MWRTPARLIGKGQCQCPGRHLSTQSTATLTENRGPSSPQKRPRLYQVLSALGATGGTVTDALNDHARDGMAVKKSELIRCAKSLRKYGRVHDSLEIMEWMEKRGIEFNNRDLAVRLDLICKAKGITEGENYFNGLPPSAKDSATFGALLNSYCKELDSEKALKHFQKMEELNFVIDSLPFNNLMSLHMRLNQPEKVPDLVNQMKRRNISPSTFTYNIWIQSLGQMNDLEGVDKVLEEMRNSREEEQDEHDWTTYRNLANVYASNGQFERAKSALKKVEQLVGPLNDRNAYHFLLTLYAKISDLDEVHRVWGCIKLQFQHQANFSCLVMLQALAKLNDIDGMTKVFQEWENVCSSYDMRLATVVIKAYLENGMYDEAEAVFNRAIERSPGKHLKAREMLMIAFMKKGRVDVALKQMKAALGETTEPDENPWRPSEQTVDEFFGYFEQVKDVDGAEKLWKALKNVGLCNRDVYRLLLKTYAAAGKSGADVRGRMKEDGIEVDVELRNLLDMVSHE